MAKPTVFQSLLGRPSQKYSFPQEKIYYSTKRDMFRIATESISQAPPLTAFAHDKAKSAVIKPTNDVGALNDRLNGLLIAEEDKDEDDDSDYDVFYTPNTSPRTSMASTISPPLKPSTPTAVTSTKTSLTHVNTSTTSISSSVLDAHSLFSFASSESTSMTSPAQSDSGKTTSHRKTNSEPPQVVNGHAGQEWSKDVRWLVPMTVKATTTPKRRHTGSQAETLSQPQTRTKPTTPMSKSISKTTPSIMSNMAALLEEEELVCTPDMLYHPRSSVLISTPRRYKSRNRQASDPSPPVVWPQGSRFPPDASLRRRRSRSLGHASASYASTSSHHTTSSRTPSRTSSPSRNSKYASSSADPYDRNLTSLPTFNSGDLPSHGTPGYTSLVLPRAPVPLSQASHHPKGMFSLKDTHVGTDTDGKVDLTRNGIAQTTMASVEVVRGLGNRLSSSTSTSPGQKLIGLFRRGSSSTQSSSGPNLAGGSPRNKRNSEDRAGKGKETSIEPLDSPLGFTSYRAPPKHVPSGSVLVQVWAASLDGVDLQLVLGGSRYTESTSLPNAAAVVDPLTTPPSTPKRSGSLRSTLGRLGGTQHRSSPSTPISNPGAKSPSTPPSASCTSAANVGYIPGRGFVGRILECGWEVEEEIKRGDWVIGLLDLKKAGALTEFIVVDRHRVHRVPHPHMQRDELFKLQSGAQLAGGEPSSSKTHSVTFADTPSSSHQSSPSTSPSPSRTNSVRTVTPKAYRPFSLNVGSSRHNNIAPSNSTLPMSLEELALLPLCGIPAYRAVRTFAFAFSDGKPGSPANNHEDTHTSIKGKGKEALDGTRRRRVLVLRGQDGTGALAAQMLVCRGWRVCVHVPFTCLPYEDASALEGTEEGGKEMRDEYCMRMVEERVRAWGGEEVIFDDGDEGEGGRGAVIRVIDRLCEDGDVFDAVLDTVGGKEVREASERLLRTVSVASGGRNGRKGGKKIGMGIKQFTTLVGDAPERTIPSASDNFKAGLRSLHGSTGGGKAVDGKKLEGKVGYAWVSLAQDVDWEGEGTRETLGAVLKTLSEDGIRPWVGGSEHGNGRPNDRVIPFEKAPQVLVNSDRNRLTVGGTVVVKIVG